MRELLKKIHLYAGLVSFSAMIIWGLTGVFAMLEPAPGQRERPAPVVRMLGRTLPDSLDDRAASEWIRQEAGLRMANPAVLRRQRDRLTCDFYGPNGMTRAEVIEPARQVRITENRADLEGFLNRMHAMSPNRARVPEWPLRAWGFYNEASLWALFLMIVTGVWLWLAGRPNWKPAWVVFAAGTGAFAALWMASF